MKSSDPVFDFYLSFMPREQIISDENGDPLWCVPYDDSGTTMALKASDPLHFMRQPRFSLEITGLEDDMLQYTVTNLTEAWLLRPHYPYLLKHIGNAWYFIPNELNSLLLRLQIEPNGQIEGCIPLSGGRGEYPLPAGRYALALGNSSKYDYIEAMVEFDLALNDDGSYRLENVGEALYSEP